MDKNLTAEDRQALTRLASTLGKGTPERRAILSSLKQALPRKKQVTVTIDHRPDTSSGVMQPFVQISGDPTAYYKIGRGQWVTPTGIKLHRDLVPFVEFVEKHG